MKPDTNNIFEFAKKCCHDLIQPQLADYARSDTIEDCNEQYPCKCLEILFTSEKSNKNLAFRFCVGENIYGKTYYSLDFTIGLSTPINGFDGRPYFRLGDYYKYKKVDRDVNGFFFADVQSGNNEKIEKFINEAKSFLEDDTIKLLISSGEWIVVPQDRSEYF